jgi:hypothetical protein
MNLHRDPGFFFGLGLMGVVAGFGIGGKSPNKWALIAGALALFRANQLHPIVDISPREEFYQQLPEVPSLPTVQDVRAKVGLRVPVSTQRSV